MSSFSAISDNYIVHTDLEDNNRNYKQRIAMLAFKIFNVVKTRKYDILGCYDLLQMGKCHVEYKFQHFSSIKRRNHTRKVMPQLDITPH